MSHNFEFSYIRYKKIILCIVDAALISFIFSIAAYNNTDSIVSSIKLFPIVMIILWISGIYRIVNSASSFSTILLRLLFPVCLVGIGYLFIFNILLVEAMLATIISALSVSLYRKFLRDYLNRAVSPKVNSAVYGVCPIVTEITAGIERACNRRVLFYIDEDSSLAGRIVNKRRVFQPSDLNKLIAQYDLSEVIINENSKSLTQVQNILLGLHAQRLNVRRIRNPFNISRNNLLDYNIDHLLGRDPVPADTELLQNAVNGKIVLVTGAGGSIGSELCRQILKCNPEMLLLLDSSEFSLYLVERSLSQQGLNGNFVAILGDSKSDGLLNSIFSKYKIDIVYHAAAYKHVPLVESNIVVGLKNNVISTSAVCKVSKKFAVPKVVLVSTDKAVRPTNVMGASKRLCEKIVLAYARDSLGTTFSIVRFGNVLGSSGSVVPLFKDQINDGGPITLTDVNITRFFMSIQEACQLIIQSSQLASGGEVFILDMGEPVKIYDLAKNMITLAGKSVKDNLNPDGDIGIEVIGLRDGEKLYEELAVSGELITTQHQKIRYAIEPSENIQTVELFLREIEGLSFTESNKAISILEKNVECFAFKGKANVI